MSLSRSIYSIIQTLAAQLFIFSRLRQCFNLSRRSHHISVTSMSVLRVTQTQHNVRCPLQTPLIFLHMLISLSGSSPFVFVSSQLINSKFSMSCSPLLLVLFLKALALLTHDAKFCIASISSLIGWALTHLLWFIITPLLASSLIAIIYFIECYSWASGSCNTSHLLIQNIVRKLDLHSTHTLSCFE